MLSQYNQLLIYLLQTVLLQKIELISIIDTPLLARLFSKFWFIWKFTIWSILTFLVGEKPYLYFVAGEFLYSGTWENNITLFEYSGGDTLILFDKAKICHSRRVFGKQSKTKKILNLVDIKLALELMKSNKVLKKDKDVPFGMYT